MDRLLEKKRKNKTMGNYYVRSLVRVTTLELYAGQRERLITEYTELFDNFHYLPPYFEPEENFYFS